MSVQSWDMIPIGPEDFDAWEQEKLDRKRDWAAKGRISLHAVGLLGGIWLANPLDKEDLDVTTLWGLGGRATYGFNRYLGFEGELIYAWSNQARFDAGMEGALTREAKLGRLSAGFLLMLGNEIVPTFRGGVGLQGVSHDARMELGEKIDTGFESDAVWYFDFGIDWRPSEELTLGTAASYFGEASQAGGGGTTAVLQLGIHAAISWKP